jgi:hypothetical protein
VQHEAAETAGIALSQSFKAYGDKLERVEVFKYLGQLLADNNNNTQAMRKKLMKARKSWGQVSHVLRAENALPKVCGMFYTATIQAVLLFGSEPWMLSPLSLTCLEGFHVWAEHHIVSKIPTRNLDGMWRYPSSKDVLKVVGLRTINHYIGVCWETITRFIRDQPLRALCRDGERKRGSVSHILVGAAYVNQCCGVSLLGDEGDMDDNHKFQRGQSVWLNYFYG